MQQLVPNLATAVAKMHRQHVVHQLLQFGRARKCVGLLKVLGYLVLIMWINRLFALSRAPVSLCRVAPLRSFKSLICFLERWMIGDVYVPALIINVPLKAGPNDLEEIPDVIRRR